MSKGFRKYSTLASGSAAAMLAALAIAPAAYAQEQVTSFNIPEQPLATALLDLGRQAHISVAAPHEVVAGRTAKSVQGDLSTRAALIALLDGSGLSYDFVGPTAVRITADPQSGSAAGDGADGTVAALIVTAQKKEEQIQDVPIAISAFTEKSLEEQKIEGGFDLLKAIPNVTFSKNNFTSYNFSIRGIGTKAVSATTDPGVAVAFNNAALIQNRLFEQEYFDVERVEVLRGPQGTLYGRNATAGVINVISAKPNLREFSGWVKGEVGNYDAKRVSAMVNVPLVSDKLAIRFAGALTDRQGYDYNDTTKHHVNGRDLWSGRITIAFNPTEQIRTSLLWERFNEDDNRSRTGKQLCKRDPGPTKIGSATIGWGPVSSPVNSGMFFSQGCLPVSLYDKAALGTPNGFAIPFVGFIIAGGSDYGAGEFSGKTEIYSIGSTTPGGQLNALLKPVDPYGGRQQNPDLRVINSIRDPIYRAKADVVQFNIDYDLTSSLLLTSQTTYDADHVYSFQDYNRFNTQPVFNDTSHLYTPFYYDPFPPHEYTGDQLSPWSRLAPGGVYCDPQIGCSNSIAGFDISKASSRQFGEELRLQSSFTGPVNFSFGVNYTKFKVLADYYVMFNLISAIAQQRPFNVQGDPTKCNVAYNAGFFNLLQTPVANGSAASGCPYIDPNPVENINGEGHNYFRSENPYKLSSKAAFGELYWQVRDDLRMTAGLRYTDDSKVFTPIPSELLLGTSLLAAGDVNRGYPAQPDIRQHWGEFTGRLGADWKPKLSFTDQTMVYAFYSRGYKGGGANPPGVGFSKQTVASILGLPPGNPATDVPWVFPIAQNSSPTFKPEFVNAFELGAKNTLMGGALVFNTDAFFYDYKDYQVSKIVDRTAVNENFDARIWGLEFETVFSPTRNLRFLGNLGYLDTAIGKGARSIDIMNRTQGNPDWVLLKPWVQLPSNCIAPKAVVEQYLLADESHISGVPICGGLALAGFGPPVIDPATGQAYTPLTYPEVNGGAGFAQNLEGHELPNAPHWTANIGAQYSIPFADSWKATIRADGYWQSQSWARVYNAVNDKLHGWYNANLSVWVENDDGLKIEFYAKNILDKSPITDAFINSDDTALTTNVFTLDPRLIGLSIKKDF